MAVRPTPTQSVSLSITRIHGWFGVEGAPGGLAQRVHHLKPLGSRSIQELLA